MRRRLIAVMLLLALLVTALPVQTSAAQSKEQRLKDRITEVYARSLRRLGTSSFLGYCGRAVNNQLYFLGIDTKVRGCDGKDEFDQYRKLGTTSGGYPCRAYPAGKYTLEQALNTISANGTRDVYNILVGFESTSSQAGKEFGHVVLIYGILDGIVYFAESSPVILNGRYWPEGSAITCTIEDFCQYYAPWTTLDGLIWFGNNNYSEKCQQFDAALEAMVMVDTPLLATIPDPEQYQDPELLETAQAGQILSVSGILKTPAGEYWYEVEWEQDCGYVEASACRTMQVTADRVFVGWGNVHMPAFWPQGRIFALGGELHAGNGRFREVEVTVSQGADRQNLYTAVTETEAKTLRLSDLTAGEILWQNLPEGQYDLTIRATVQSYTVENGELRESCLEKELWHSEFWVVGHHVWLPEISFDACGGDTPLERTAAVDGGSVQSLPTPRRKGYTFLGWYTQPEGGQRITEETEFLYNTIVYAHWEQDPQYAGWLQVDGDWTYYRNGEPVYGWFRYNGLRFWQDNLGKVPHGWRKIGGQWYHFSGCGAADTGWIFTERGISYLLYDGRMAVGEITIGGIRRHFDQQGVLELH